MLVQNLPGLIQRRAFRRRDEVLPGHDLGDLEIHACLEAQVPVGHNTDELAVLGHRNAGNPVLLHDLVRVADGVVWRDGHRVQNHAALGFLDLVHFGRLVCRREHPMDDPDTALTGDRDGQPGLGDRVHGGADDRDVDRDAAGQPRAGVGFGRQDGGFSGDQRHIVEGQSHRQGRLQHVVIVSASTRDACPEFPVGSSSSPPTRRIRTRPPRPARAVATPLRRPS